jgi:hypothetical protein
MYVYRERESCTKFLLKEELNKSYWGLYLYLAKFKRRTE